MVPELSKLSIGADNDEGKVHSEGGARQPGPHAVQILALPEECTIVWRLLAAMHDQLGGTVLCQYIHSLKTVEALHGSSPLLSWSLFAGSGISTHFRRLVCMFWAKRYGVKLSLPTTAYAEHDGDKQAWLHAQHGSDDMVIVSKVNELSRISVVDSRNSRGSSPNILSQPKFSDAGIPCTSRSSLNMNSKNMVDCCQNEVGATGVGFKETGEVLQRHGIRCGLWECVHGLWQRSQPDKTNDAEYMVKKFQDMGYWTMGMQTSGKQYSSWNARLRGYWGACADIDVDNTDANAWHSALMSGFKTSPGFQFEADDFLDLTDHARLTSARAIGVPSHLDLGLRESQTQQSEASWKTEHLALFHQKFGLESWPIQDYKATPSWIRFHGMLPREREQLIFLDRVFPPPPLPAEHWKYFEFLDINSSMQRLIKTHLNSETGETKGTPWRTSAPTLVGSGKIVMRFTVREADKAAAQGKLWTICVFECWEEARMAGWDDTWWSAESQVHTHEDVELVSNLFGNMFSAFNYVPFFCSLVSCWGKFHKGCVAADRGSGGQEVQSDSESPQLLDSP